MNYSSKKILNQSVILFLSLVIGSFSLEANTNVNYLGFRINSIISDQGKVTNTQTNAAGSFTSSTSRVSYSGELGWTPNAWFTNDIGAILDIGATFLKNQSDSSFFVSTYQLFLAYRFIPTLELEAGGGAQTWFNNGGTQAIISGNLAYVLPKESWFYTVFAGYSRFMLKNNGAHEYRVGVGFNIN